jgi:hypothetical protein
MYFHSDQCYVERPIKATTLYAIELPRQGGNTLFANMYLAYETLPADVQRQIAGLKAMNVYDYDNNPTTRGSTIREGVPHYAHPIVRTHPDTGRKALFVPRATGCSGSYLTTRSRGALSTNMFGVLVTSCCGTTAVPCTRAQISIRVSGGCFAASRSSERNRSRGLTRGTGPEATKGQGHARGRIHRSSNVGSRTAGCTAARPDAWDGNLARAAAAAT